MRRSFLTCLVLAICVPAGLALFGTGRTISAQEDPKLGEKLDDLIRTLTETLRSREAPTGAPVIAYEQHIYDVRDLAVPIEDYPVRVHRLVPSGGFGFDEEDSEPVDFLEPDALVDLIRESVAPASWDELSSVSIAATDSGYLVVRHTAGVHGKIAQLLAELRRGVGTRVTVDMRLIDLGDADLRGAVGPGFVLDDAAAEVVLAAKVVRSASVTASNRQVVGLTDASLVSYIQDYAVEIAEEASIGDPIVETFTDGFVAQVKPIVSGGDLVILEVRGLAQKAKRPIETVEAPFGAIETPCVEILDLRTTLALRVGCWTVAGGALLDGDGHGWLLIVRATPSRPSGK
jgi:hypothetical protein